MVLDFDEQALVEGQLIDFPEGMRELEAEGDEIFIDETVGDEDGAL